MRTDSTSENHLHGTYRTAVAHATFLITNDMENSGRKSDCIRHRICSLQVLCTGASAANCRAEGAGLRDAVVGAQATFKVLVRTNKDHPFTLPKQGEELQVTLSPEQDPSSKVEGSVSCGSAVAEYVVQYVPLVAGKCRLDVKLDGVAIAGSPFKVQAACGMTCLCVAVP